MRVKEDGGELDVELARAYLSEAKSKGIKLMGSESIDSAIEKLHEINASWIACHGEKVFCRKEGDLGSYGMNSHKFVRDFKVITLADLKPKRTKGSTAMATLKNLGYTWNGGELWKPPLGKEPDYIKPVKVEYEKVDKNAEGGKYWECARDFAEMPTNSLVARTNPPECSVMSWMNIKDNDELLREYRNDRIYRKVEREVSWQDEVVQFLDSYSSYDFNKYIGFKNANGDTAMQADFIKLCHLVASMTGKPK